jgi:hypothetical protein
MLPLDCCCGALPTAAAPGGGNCCDCGRCCGGGGGGGGNEVTIGAGACTVPGFGSARVSVCAPFCSVAVRRATDCKIQPAWPSPVRKSAAPARFVLRAA